MSKFLFFKKFITDTKQTGAILPSSSFLAKKMVKKSDIENSKIIVELGAGNGIFTEYIFKYSKGTINDKKIFIIEKDIDFYNVLIKKFPDYKENIFNIDVMDLEKLLIKNNIKEIDLIISGLPFKSLPKKIFIYLVEDLFLKFFKEETKFIQFSYFKTFSKTLEKYFLNVSYKRCLLNIPVAYAFECFNIKNNKIK